MMEPKPTRAWDDGFVLPQRRATTFDVETTPDEAGRRRLPAGRVAGAAADLIDFSRLGHDAIYALAFGRGRARPEVYSDRVLVMSARLKLVEAKGG
jgi:hypothetical protein